MKSFPGVARLTFTDRGRTELSKLEWKGEEDNSFEDGGTFTYALPPAGAYIPPQNAVPKKSQLVRPRPDQALFRKTLGLAYGQACSVTGCMVDQVLEAAHIDDYIAPDSNHPSNGILLRRDIHALFDAHLIAIEPDTHVIHVAPMAQQKGGYTEWQGRKITLPKEETHQPDPGALKRRWQKFNAAHR
ncbi:MAG: HNH endonuclease [Opitutus sp.]|nr:HNH endonuclease [Opitutus sp.]MCS6246374.1 HNH endonuclease [Opitutus sp.]MCS6275311.1 HNH endonuclease [Opitutus sp.]MCS6278296.1 HNH endonuclease [Opitutus sp.]MCS6299406.1 HNH endonuclease [Opitutus sp.]